jgi:hypothetical protein
MNDVDQPSGELEMAEVASSTRRPWMKPSVRRMVAGDAENGLTNTRSDSLTGFSKS